MSKEQIIKKLLEENVETGIKYHSPLPGDISPWYVYTRNSGHRILCVPENTLFEGMTEDDYHNRLVSAPVKTVLGGYTTREGFIIIDCEYNTETGFITEQGDREFDTGNSNVRYALKVGELYLPEMTSWPEAVEYNYFSNNHELRFKSNDFCVRCIFEFHIELFVVGFFMLDGDGKCPLPIADVVPVFLCNPLVALSFVSAFRPLPQAFVYLIVNFAEHLRRYNKPLVVHPAPDNGIEFTNKSFLFC